MAGQEASDLAEGAGPATAEPLGSYWSGYDLLWDLPGQNPKRRTSIDRAQVVSAAIAIADREELGAVSMRSVASELGTSAMALYRHIPDKEAMVALMVDAAIARSISATSARARAAVIGQGSAQERPERWRERLRLVAAGTWELCRRHRWFPEASLGRPLITPSGLAGFERALSIFDDFDLDIGTKARFVGSVHSTVISCALYAHSEESARARAQMTREQVFAAAAPFMRQVINSGEFPRVTAFVVEAEHAGSEAEMWANVELLLDGIASRLASSPSHPKRPGQPESV